LGDVLIRVLAVRIPAIATIMITEEVLTERHRAHWDAREDARLAALRDACDRWRAEGGGAARHSEWHAETGDPEALVAAHGQRADYLVVARPCRRDGRPQREMMHAALFETGRPLLVVPCAYRGSFGASVAVAWKDDGRAVKAMFSAMPLLRQAREVRVFIGTRPGGPAPGLPEVLVEHAVAATLGELPLGRRGTFGADLLDAVRIAGADLLVMGAYARGPWREMLLGGVTRDVLAQAAIPVLMRH
jgi:nucleotide-binding universal stress UspA family protein